jgi:pimeloyl-ACP methyl ester carboxylesterase
VSTPRTLLLPDGVHRVTVETARGAFAALEALPAAGIAERGPALLVPGYTGSKEDFLAILGPLAAAGRRILAIDMRGQYQSPAAAGPDGYRVAALAADLAAIADWLHTGGQPVHLLGHSFGGLVAQDFALGHRHRIASLTLMSSGPGALTGIRAAVLRAVLARLNADAPGGLSAGIRRLWETELEPAAVADGVPADIIGFLRARMLSSCPTGLATMAAELLACPDRIADVAKLDAPALVVYGEGDDAWAPAIQDDMAHRLGAVRVCIPSAAHSPAVEAPGTAAGILTGFWNAAESGRH